MSNDIKKIIDGITDLQRRVAHLEANLRTFSGQSAVNIEIQNNQPALYFHELDALTDEKYWVLLETGGDLAFQVFDDNLSVGTNALYLGRTADVFTYMQVGSYYSTDSFLRIIPRTRQSITAGGDIVFGAISGMCLVSVYSQSEYPGHNSVLIVGQHDGSEGNVAVVGQSAGTGTALSAYTGGAIGLAFFPAEGGIVLHNYFAYSLQINWIEFSIPFTGV